MKPLALIFCICLALASHAATSLSTPTTESTQVADSIGEKSGKIVSQEQLRNYTTVSLDYVASELTGELSAISGQDVYLIHSIYVIVNGVNYYPQEESIEEKLNDDLSFRAFYHPRINPEEIVCRNGKPKTFRILLPDHPKMENGKYNYRIEYYADAFNGGICDYRFTHRRTLGDLLSDLTHDAPRQ